jgi:hypothetical protein
MTTKEKLIVAAARHYPGSEILVSFPELWEQVSSFKRGNIPLYVAGFPPSQERSWGDHFFGLSPEINRSLTTYRQYKLFEPQTTHLFVVEWNSYLGQGRIIGGGRTQVHLQPLGQAQMWKGEKFGVLWECYFFGGRRGGVNWQEELMTFWRAVEGDMGVSKIFTQPQEPTFPEGYTDFLRRLGYAPDPEFERWWSKNQ